MSKFSSVEAAPPIEVFKLTRDFQADTHPQKVNTTNNTYMLNGELLGELGCGCLQER